MTYYKLITILPLLSACLVLFQIHMHIPNVWQSIQQSNKCKLAFQQQLQDPQQVINKSDIIAALKLIVFSSLKLHSWAQYVYIPQYKTTKRVFFKFVKSTQQFYDTTMIYSTHLLPKPTRKLPKCNCNLSQNNWSTPIFFNFTSGFIKNFQ